MASREFGQRSGSEVSEHEADSSDSEFDDKEVVVQRRVDVDEKDSDEEALERFVLGDRATFRENLFKDTVFEAEDSLQDLSLGEFLSARATGLEDADDSALFFYDSTAVPGQNTQSVKADVAVGTKASDANAPAWEDSDDEKLLVSLASVGRLRKLRSTEAEDAITGAEYTHRLRQQYLRLNPLPSWATEAERRLVKRRRSSASSASSSDEEGARDDETEAALPLDKFLRSASALSSGVSSKKRKLRPEVIDIQKTRDIPDSHSGPVASLSFHPRYPVLLSSSTSSVLNLHHIAPTAHPTPNPLLTSVQVKRTPVRRSAFLFPDGDQVIFAGRRKYFHSWDISTGRVKKVTKVQGHRLEQKSMERFRLSPSGEHMATIATDRKGGGMLNILDVNTMQWVAQARLDSRGGIADFSWWSTGEGITILGRDGQVGEWSLESKRFLGTWRDEGSTGGTVIALGGHLGPAALGGDKFVAIGSNSGVVNLYTRSSLVLPPSSKTGGGEEVDIKPLPEPARCFEQLTTPATQVVFSPDGQLLAFASQHKRDALRLVHTESRSVYRNWPTDQTPLGRITAVAFGTGSDLLAVGNDNGKIRLWEIRS